jgi:hypothetical protein
MALVLVVGLAMVGCGDEGAESAARTPDKRVPAVSAVPLARGARVTFDGTDCPATPERCIRSAVLRGAPGQSSLQLRRAQQAALERARWIRIPACASPFPQYEDRRRAVEVFLKPSRDVAAGKTSTPALRDRLAAAIRADARDQRATLVLEIAEAAETPPC